MRVDGVTLSGIRALTRRIKVASSFEARSIVELLIAFAPWRGCTQLLCSPSGVGRNGPPNDHQEAEIPTQYLEGYSAPMREHLIESVRSYSLQQLFLRVLAADLCEHVFQHVVETADATAVD
jgi:hypothetical protein